MLKKDENKRMIEKVCQNCKKIFYVDKFHHYANFCCTNCRQQAYRKTGMGQEVSKKYTKSILRKKAVQKYNRCIKNRYNNYKYRAKQKNIIFSMTLKNFSKFVNLPCWYCGGKGYGIDRLDISRGYSFDNIVPCCWECNGAKNIMTPMEYINHCRRVVKKWEKN